MAVGGEDVDDQDRLLVVGQPELLLDRRHVRQEHLLGPEDVRPVVAPVRLGLRAVPLLRALSRSSAAFAAAFL